MHYEVRMEARAWQTLRKLDDKTRGRIRAAILDLGRDPRPRGCKKLKGTGDYYYRIRVGVYRVLYEVQEKVLLVLVLKVGRRGNVYRGIRGRRI